MNRFPDHPFVREAIECPLCGSPKKVGHVACYECGVANWTDGTEMERHDAELLLDAAEEQHAADNEQFRVGA